MTGRAGICLATLGPCAINRALGKANPDGRLLASGGLDQTGLVWDVTGLSKSGKLPPRNLRQDEIESLWSDLGGEDGETAFRAQWMMVAAASQSVPFLAMRLRPETAEPQERLEHLIADLDSNQFHVRIRAHKELEELGDRAQAALRRAVAAKPSPEAYQRLKNLLAKAQVRAFSAKQILSLRAIEVLEQIATAEARQVLKRIAGGASEARLTREAKASLERLVKRAPATR